MVMRESMTNAWRILLGAIGSFPVADKLLAVTSQSNRDGTV
jgi:hypothetical protein